MFFGVFYSRPTNAENKKLTKWKDLPLEMKEMIIQRSTEGTRNALRACSTDNKKLVEETKINSISKMETAFLERSREWVITVYRLEALPWAAPDVIHKLKSFEELQRTIPRILKGVHCLKKLCVYKLNADTLLKLLPPNSQSRLLVESVVLHTENSNQLENILSQIEPGYLRNITMKDEGNSKVYDMQQVILAENLVVENLSSIREDQLLKLEGEKIEFDSITCSIKEYTKKIAVEKSNDERARLIFGGAHAYNEVVKMCESNCRKVPLATDFEYLNFYLSPRIIRGNYFVTCDFLYNYHQTESFLLSWEHHWQKVTKLVFRYHPETTSYIFEIERETHNEYEYTFRSFLQAQKALHTILSVTSYIRKFSVNLDSSEKPLVWPKRKEKLTVVHLEVLGNHSIANSRQLLEQIDPVFVKSLTIKSDEVDNDLFNIEHVSYASEVYISGAVLHDDQLLRMKTQHFASGIMLDNSSIQNKSLTANALNQYIKYCLFDSSDKNHYFSISKLSEELDTDEIYRDCIISYRYDFMPGFWQTFTVAGSEYVMHSIFYRNRITGVRQKRNNPLIWWSDDWIPWIME